jgi:RNA polymerase sporulation-specific sigma factor
MSENVSENSFTNTDIADERDRLRALVAEAQKGDQDAFARLLDAYDPLISSTVSKFKISGMSDADEEDLRQEAVLAFYSSLVSYDPNISGVEFGLYAKVCICNRLVSQMRILKRHLSHSVVSYDTEKLLRQLASEEDPASRIAELESERSLLRLINDNLSKYEQRVFRMYVSGMSASEMAKKLDSSEKSVNNAVTEKEKK